MRDHRTAFTLIELLIVIFIIAILLQLSLPAIQGSREAARRASCQNILRQIGIAFQNYEGAKRVLPVGANACCMGTWMTALFPYMEESSSYEAYYSEPLSPGEDPPRYTHDVNLVVTQKFYPTFTCPSDKPRLRGKEELSKHSYTVNYGTTANSRNGGTKIKGLVDQGRSAWKSYRRVEFQGAPFFVNRAYSDPTNAIKLVEITDGLSNTLFTSETIQTTGEDIRGLIWGSQGSGYMAFLAPNSTEPDILSPAGKCDGTGVNPPCSTSGSKKDTDLATYAARSRHPAGVNGLRGDASVEFYSETIELPVWRALHTTQGGESPY